MCRGVRESGRRGRRFMVKRYDKLGRGDDVPVVNRGAQPDTSKVEVVDWTVLARVDGKRTVDEILGMLPMPAGEALGSLARLKSLGLIDLEGAAAASVNAPLSVTGSLGLQSGGGIRPSRGSMSAGAGRSAAVAGGRGAGGRKGVSKTKVRVPWPTTWPVSIGKFTFDPLELDEDVEIGLEKRRQVLYYHFYLERLSYYDLMQLPRDADTRMIRKAYFKLSKEFHPDLYFRKELGSYRRKVEEIFQWLSKAYSVLSDEASRAEYDGVLSRGSVGPWAMGGQGAGLRAASASGVNFSSGDKSSDKGAQSPLSGPQLSAASRARPIENNIVRAARDAEGKGHWDRAYALYRKQLGMGFDPLTAHSAAVCLLKLKKGLAQAEELCRRALGQLGAGQHRQDAILTLAQIVEAEGRRDEARMIYNEVLKLDPEHSVAKTQVEYLTTQEPMG